MPVAEIEVVDDVEGILLVAHPSWTGSTTGYAPRRPLRGSSGRRPDEGRVPSGDPFGAACFGCEGVRRQVEQVAGSMLWEATAGRDGL